MKTPLKSMKRALPFFIVLTLIYLAGAYAALCLNDPELRRLLTRHPYTVIGIYLASYAYFCFVFWMFDYGIQHARRRLSRIIGVPIREVSRRGEHDLGDHTYLSWDLQQSTRWAPLVYLVEALLYGGSVVFPIAIMAFWAYRTFS